MRGSIIIAAHNEGELLSKTVASVEEMAAILRLEIVVADDASSDGSVERLTENHPQVRVVRHRERLGSSPTKDLGARSARGELLLFLDGHTKPESGAIFRLLQTVEKLGGDAIVTPRVPILDVERWENLRGRSGYGFGLVLPDLTGGWVPLSTLKRRDPFFESPTLCGCCFAMTRDLYQELRGFDRYMRQWGPEDFDLGLKAWLLGHPILNDPMATIGHRFIEKFPYHVAMENIVANQIRIAWKNFTQDGFQDWLPLFRARQETECWERGWSIFLENKETAEEERQYLARRRVHDERWFAATFGCGWPPGARETVSPPVQNAENQ
jgi:GT2 family glycosyltransferase